jgi:arylsulfatase A-like enzyme
MNTPNIVIILCDDLGYGDCSCYGQQNWLTPNIDCMASEGIRFTDFYTTSPVCSPARASILTGLHSGHLPIRELSDPYLPDDIMTIPWILKKRGYVSACLGKYGVGNKQPDVDPLRKGFDYHYGYNCMVHAHNYFPPFLRENGLRVPLRNLPPADDLYQWETGIGVAAVKIDYSPDLIEEQAVEFIRDCADRPFFLHYCTTLPHANNEGGDSPDGMEVDNYGEFIDRDWAPNEKGFARMVQRIDQTVGRILKTLEEVGIADNTIVIFTSDNGPHNEGGHSVKRFDSSGGFQGYKRSLHEGGIRIPFIVRWPGVIQPEISNYIGFFPDIMATICDLTGLEIPSNCDGISIKPLLCEDNSNQLEHDYLYFEYQNQIAIRCGDWKFFRYDHRNAPFSIENTNDDEALFNIAVDNHEDNDLKNEYPNLMRDLKAYVFREHNDYVPIPIPPNYDKKFNNKSKGDYL